MKAIFNIVILAFAAVWMAACGAPATNTNTNTNTNTTKPTAAAPTADALLALDQQANEAYIKSDSKFFEGMLSYKFVMLRLRLKAPAMARNSHRYRYMPHLSM